MIVRKAAKPRIAVPLTACQQLANAKAQMILLASGQAVAEVDTPQLGRVVFSKGDIGSLQRLIDQLTVACAIENGQPASSAGGRKPFSFEAWP
jgi:hypothetical protein